jgi:hypothetical protein
MESIKPWLVHALQVSIETTRLNYSKEKRFKKGMGIIISLKEFRFMWKEKFINLQEYLVRFVYVQSAVPRRIKSLLQIRISRKQRGRKVVSMRRGMMLLQVKFMIFKTYRCVME